MTKHRFLDKANKKPKIPQASEYQIHCAIADYLGGVIRYPSRWTTIEVSNQSSGKAAMFRQIALKRKGVTTGFPDIMIFWCKNEAEFRNTTLIFLEVKVPGGKLTDKQEALHNELRSEGHHVHVVYGVEDVIKVLKELGVV